MVDQTAAPTAHTMPSLAMIILGWLKRPTSVTHLEDPYKDAVEKARADLAETAKSTLSDTSRKLLEASLSDLSGI